MSLPKQLTSQYCPQQILDKRSITRGLWPPRFPDMYAYGYYLWENNERRIHILIARTVR